MSLFTTAQRVRICAVLGLLIAGLAPLVTQWTGSGVPPLVKNYLAPDYNYFGFFPWAAYVAFGMSAGSLHPTIEARGLRSRDAVGQRCWAWL